MSGTVNEIKIVCRKCDRMGSVTRHASRFCQLVAYMSESLKPIPSNPPRWKPSLDPANIVIQSLDTEASTVDQIEQIEQLITIKLQVG